MIKDSVVPQSESQTSICCEHELATDYTTHNQHWVLSLCAIFPVIVKVISGVLDTVFSMRSMLCQTFLSPVATKLRKGDIGLPFVRLSVRPSALNNLKTGKVFVAHFVKITIILSRRGTLELRVHWFPLDDQHFPCIEHCLTQCPAMSDFPSEHHQKSGGHVWHVQHIS